MKRILAIAALLIAPHALAQGCPVTTETLALQADWYPSYAGPVTVTKDCTGVVRIEGGLVYFGAPPGNVETPDGGLVPSWPAPFKLPDGYCPATYQIIPTSVGMIPGEIHITPLCTLAVIGRYMGNHTLFSGVTFRTP